MTVSVATIQSPSASSAPSRVPVDSAPPAAPSPEAALLARVFETLDAAGVPYCALHGYADYSRQVAGDVDLLIPRRFSAEKLARLLYFNRPNLGAKVVQWFDDGAIFIVLAADGAGPSRAMLQLHVSRDVAMDGRVFFEGDEVISSRRRHGNFWTAAPGIEFSSIIVNRLCKRSLKDHHAHRLSELYASAGDECRKTLSRFVSDETLKAIMLAARGGDWKPIRDHSGTLRREVLHSRNTRPDGPGAAKIRRARRWMRPANGLHVVFLGPDGVGKSTVIETFQRDIAQAFLRSAYMTFAPSLIPAKLAPKKSTPHELPPRSKGASLIKAAWWLVCYTLGYFASVRTVIARGGLVVNHRYLLDAIVDQKRYRYSGPVWLLRWIWSIAPKPDLVFLLDAPAEVIRRRKSELPLDEIARQRQAYRRVVTPLPYGRVIDAARPLPAVIAEVEAIVLDRLADREVKRMNFIDENPRSGGVA